MPSQIKPTSVRLEPELLKQLEELAQMTHRSKSRLIQEALRYYVEEQADINIAFNKLHDPNTEYLDWDKIRDELLRQD
ncbi:MAG: ribbon-helix-helix protein, CopG family [Nitrospirae bacterium]|nr:ribbon-helix-helix protein, CopG family [Nitrospirota bacterium]